MSDNPVTIQEEAAELEASNSSRMNVLQMQGIAINMQMLTLRHLIETIFPTDEERFEMNLSFQKRLADELTNAESQIDAINLQRAAAQAQQGSGLLIPGAPHIDV